MVAITALKPDDVVYSVTRQKAGNTNLRRDAVHRVRIMWVGVLFGLSGLESGWALGWFEAGLLSTIGFGLALGALFSRRQPGRVPE